MDYVKISMVQTPTVVAHSSSRVEKHTKDIKSPLECYLSLCPNRKVFNMNPFSWLGLACGLSPQMWTLKTIYEMRTVSGKTGSA